MDTVIFIGGTGRCGTGVVKEALAKHPDVASLPFRCRFIVDPDGIVDFYNSSSGAWSPYVYDRKLKRLGRLLHRSAKAPLHHRLCGRVIRWLDPGGRVMSPAAYHDWNLDEHLPNFSRHAEGLMSQLVDFAYPACWYGTKSYRLFPDIHHSCPKNRQEVAQVLGNFVQAVIRDFLAQDGQTVFVDHDTYNVLFARELLELLPEAKILHVYRDPRDVVASYVHQRWCPKDKGQAAHVYRAIMEYWWMVRRSLPAGSYGELKFEDFIDDPPKHLESLCKSYNLPFHKAMLGVDLSRHHIGRWEEEYTAQEKREVQEILGDIIEKLGYQ